MPGPTPVPVQGDVDLPRSVDVVIIGGGIIGCADRAGTGRGRACASPSAKRAASAHEQSSRNWGWVRISRRDPREVPLMAEAIRLWRDMDKRTGRDTGYRQSGICFVCEDEKTFAELRSLEGPSGALPDAAAMLRPAETAARCSRTAICRASARSTRPRTAAPSRRRPRPPLPRRRAKRARTS